MAHLCESGHPMGVSDRFCPECGRDVGTRCPQGHPNVAAQKFCTECGTPLTAASAAPTGTSAPASPEVPDQASVVARAVACVRADRLNMVLAALAAAILLTIIIGVAVAAQGPRDTLTGQQLEDLLQQNLSAQDGTTIDMSTLRCATTRTYRDGDTASCDVADAYGTSYPLDVRLFRDTRTGEWTASVEIAH